MFKFVEASLIVILSVVITALVMVFLIPVHAFGDATLASESQDIRPAVFVEATGKCPVEAGAPQNCPALTRQQSGAACPYLSAMTAAAECPATAAPKARAGCPGLADDGLPKSRVKLVRAETMELVTNS